VCVIVICRTCSLVRVLQLFVVMCHMRSVLWYVDLLLGNDREK
jgi:hypothetical protein